MARMETFLIQWKLNVEMVIMHIFRLKLMVVWHVNNYNKKKNDTVQSCWNMYLDSGVSRPYIWEGGQVYTSQCQFKYFSKKIPLLY